MKLGRHSKPSNKKGGLATRRNPRSQANVAGYEKRVARKAKSNPTTDLYEHVPEKTRRSKVGLDFGRDDEGFESRDGGDGDEDEERERFKLRARLIGENEDDERIASDDDEELDSDAAFEESDEERYEGFFSRKKDPGSNNSYSDDEDDDDESASEEEELDFDPSDEEEMPEALDVLDSFVSNLDVTSTKRKATEDLGASTDIRARKRRLVKERTEAGDENEFRTRSSGSKLNLDDLLSPLETQSSALQSLKTSAKVLASSTKILSAPLPQRTQERLDRQAAYEQTKEEVDKWSETMRHIRTAEHLSFPLQSQSTGRVSNLELTAKFKPTTALESSVDALLKSAKLRDEDIQQFTLALPNSKSNPWLARVSEPTTIKLTKKTNEAVVQKESKTLDKSKNKLKKKARKREEMHDEIAKEDGVVEISLDEVLTLPPVPSHSNLSESVQKAFAGDNVVQNFEEAKSREIASDAPREVDTTIPGWGSWGGVGVRKLPPKPQRIKKIAGIDPTTRADFNKKHVIISEKRDKKAGKYLVKDLPYPYTSKAQFERAMENPLGAEWNTRVAFQRGTLPKVVKKPGIIINPLEKLSS